MLISQKASSTILGALLMYWGYPFVYSKQDLSEAEEKIADEIRERLLELRRTDLRETDDSREVLFSRSEASLLVKILGRCFDECQNDPVDLRIHLKAHSSEEVKKLLDRFQLELLALESKDD